MGMNKQLGMCNVLLILLLGCSGLFAPVEVEGSVSYDSKAIAINGKRRILISGSIHYPRSSPEVIFSHFRMCFMGIFYFLKISCF